MGLLFSLLIAFMHVAFSQEETSGNDYHFDGNVSITNNGFSFIPSFSLGKPATIADLSIGASDSALIHSSGLTWMDSNPGLSFLSGGTN